MRARLVAIGFLVFSSAFSTLLPDTSSDGDSVRTTIMVSLSPLLGPFSFAMLVDGIEVTKVTNGVGGERS
jgi:hypothetical protein